MLHIKYPKISKNGNLLFFSCGTADNNRRRLEISSSVLLQTLGKLKSLQGTELSVVVVICLLGSF